MSDFPNIDADEARALVACEDLPAQFLLQAVCQMVTQYAIDRMAEGRRMRKRTRLSIDGLVAHYVQLLGLNADEAADLTAFLERPEVRAFTNYPE